MTIIVIGTSLPELTITAETRNIQTYYTASHLHVEGSLVLIAETVGALFGLVGEQTLVYYAEYQLPGDTKYQADFVAGGLVGENRGALSNCNISSQKNNATNTLVDTSPCFNYSARVNGGIVGVNIGGLVSQCTSNITISSNQPIVTVGGIVGRNIDGFVWDCTIDGILNGFYVGGIIGTDYSYGTMINVKNGYGVATNPMVYRNVNNLVSYNGESIALKGNKPTRKFIQNFLNICKEYYEFNSKYVDNSATEPLVKTDKAFGLIIGLSDDTYNIVENDDNDNYKITLSKTTPGMGTSTTPYDLIYTVDDTPNHYTVKGYFNFFDPLFNLNGLYSKDCSPVVITYLIAKEGVAYEGWSAVSGYGDKVVIISRSEIKTETYDSAKTYEDGIYAVLEGGELIPVNNLYYKEIGGKNIVVTEGTEGAEQGFGYYIVDGENNPIVTLLTDEELHIIKWQ